LLQSIPEQSENVPIPEPLLRAAGRRWAVGKVSGCSGQVLRGAGEKRIGPGALADAFVRLAALAGSVLILTVALPAFAQSPPLGALAGKLTDLQSRPVDGATLVLRNAATGAEARTTTRKDGGYRFSGLAPGEYSLEADSPRLGEGHISGIFVAAGHKSRVQTALALDRPSPQPAVVALNVRTFADPGPRPSEPTASAMTNARPLIPLPSTDKPAVIMAPLDLQISRYSLETLSLAASTAARPRPAMVPPVMIAKEVPANEVVAAAVYISEPERPVEMAMLATPAPRSPPLSMTAALPRAITLPLLAAAFIPTPSRGASLALAGVAGAHAAAQFGQTRSAAFPIPTVLDAQTPVALPTLSDQQLEALPLSGRRWDNFVLDAPTTAAAADPEPDQPSTAARNPAPASVSVDNANMGLAFGGRAGGRMRGESLMGPGANEAAILEVRQYNTGEAAAARPGQHAIVETRAGTDQLHGQGFLFDRHNLLGAQNPFTRWVKQTGPGTSTTFPVFAPFPYTAPEHQDRWGIGLGGRIQRRKLFWFAAYDGSRRSNPGVASVRHPDSFFAQPANDEMQVLSARLRLSSVNPVAEGLAAYSGILESLGALLGPAPRTANQWVGFGRLDWHAAERHRFTLEGTGARWSSPGGGLTRVAETYGNHSFGSTRASELWILGRWDAFLTPNLLGVTQGSVGRHTFSEEPATPSSFEQTLNINAWGQLPQMVVDSRYGFTIGNPSRFGTGRYPDEHLYQLQQALDWAHGGILVKAGADWRHNADATTMIRNHTGTYHYSTIENFASDALVFAKYGLSNALDPFDQHNCDQRGRAWRDSTGQLHGLGYLPCYSYYSQTMGPTDWRLSTNDLAAFATAQWQPAKRFVLSAALRWERQYFPPPIALVDNPALPLTQTLPTPGNEWAPRVSVAWGSGESRWPVLRAGYGMYYARTRNAVLQAALTQTGSPRGDLNFFMRPTDNLTGGGAPPFPYVLAGEPSTVVKPGVVEFAPAFKNPEIHQAEATVEERLPGHFQVAASAIVSLARRLPTTVDTNFDPATNPGTITYAVVDGLNAGPIKDRQITVPFFASWPSSASSTSTAGRLNSNYQQITELMSRSNSTYEAAMLGVSRFGRRGFSFHARYIYAHAMDWNPNESTLISGSSMLDPTDFRLEYGTSNLDIRHSASAMLMWQAPWKLKGPEGHFANGWMFSGIGQFRSGLPFTMRTAGSIPEEFTATGAAIVGLGASMNGYGGDNRVYGVGRNTYRYPYTWKADVRLGKKFNLGQMRELELLAESFNLFNHQNVTRLETVGYYIAPGRASGSLPTLNFLTGLKTGQTEFGKPLDINATDYFHPRQFDFGLRMRF
jgi:Carboxypeptidase regulatory-like domain